MNTTSIKELNALLKGEYMAVDSYDNFIQTADDNDVKSELQKIQQDHKNHTRIVSERIQNLGGNPANNVGFTGKIAETFSNIKHRGMKDPVLILKTAYDGEDQGIQMSTEIVKGDLDNESAQLVKDILNSDRGHLSTLNELIQKKGGLS